MPSPLAATHLRHYEEQGVIYPIPVLAADEAAQFRAGVEAIEARLGGGLRRIDQCHLFFDWAYRLATHGAVLDVMECLLGPDLLIHSSRVFAKPPGDPAYVSWHQDGTYSNLSSKPAPSAWIALTPSTAANGCLRVIPGSHRHHQLPHTETHEADNLLNHGERVDLEIDPATVRDVELRPGEMSIHHVNILHGSLPNQSSIPRIGFALSYMTPEVGSSALPAVRARGRAELPGFELVGPPSYRDLDAALAAHAAWSRGIGRPQAKLGQTT